MRVFVFEDVMHIGKINCFERDVPLALELVGALDGSEVVLSCVESGKYAIATIKDGQAVFPASFVEEGKSYILSLTDSEGNKPSASFSIANGKIQALCDTDGSLERMWSVIFKIAGAMKAQEEIIKKYINGFETE